MYVTLTGWKFVSLLKHVLILVEEYRDYFSLPFVNQRQASPLTRKDQYVHLHPFIEDSTFIDRDYVSLISSSRDSKADDTWRQTIVICHLCYPETIESDSMQRQASLLTETTLVSPSSSRDDKSDGTRKPVMVIYHLCQLEVRKPVDRDYFSLTLLSSRDDKSDDT